MPVYEFQELKSGRVVEDYFHMNDAPECGTVVLVRGKKARRLPPRSVGAKAFDPEHVALGFHKSNGLKGLKVPRFDKDGYVAFKSMREIREFEASSGGRFKYDAR